MLVLAIDLSLHAGYALLEGEKGSKPKLMRYGTVHLGRSVYDGFGPYPYNYVKAVELQIFNLSELIRSLLVVPDVIVIEEINRGKARYSQKILDWLHYVLLDQLNNIGFDDKIVYIDTSEWRKVLGIRLNKDQKKQNAKLNKAKRQGINKKELGIRGKITPKHLSVMWTNENYGLSLKICDNDAADAICLASAFFNNATICDGR